jgi:hypothetical protein
MYLILDLLDLILKKFRKLRMNSYCLRYLKINTNLVRKMVEFYRKPLKDVESAHKRGQKGLVRDSKEQQKSLYNYNLN